MKEKKDPTSIKSYYPPFQTLTSIGGDAPYKKVRQNFEEFVGSVEKITSEMRKNGFDLNVCEELVNHFYSKLAPDKRTSNYYYVLSTPTLMNLENTLELLQLERHINVTGERVRVNKLKEQLWQLLPDFYKGHQNPMLKPLSYNPNKPYPYNTIFSTISEHREGKSRMDRSLEVYLECFEKYIDFSNTNNQTNTISIEWDERWNLKIKVGDNTVRVAFWTVFSPYKDLLFFLQQLISNQSPAFIEIDEEGPQIFFYIEYADKSENVHLLIQGDYEERLIKGVFNRQQLATELMKAFEESHLDPYEHEEESVKEQIKRLAELI